MKLKRYRLISIAFAALALLATSCSKIDNDEDNGYNSATGKAVSVTLPIGIAELETTAKEVAKATTNAMLTTSRTTATNSPEEGFTVSFDEATTTTATDAIATDTIATRGNRTTAATAMLPTTRTITQELTNVWVLQFNSSGTNVKTTHVGTLAAGAYLAPTLLTGTGYTIYIVANGPASGLSTSTTLTAFESTMLHTAAVTDAMKLPLSGKLTGVTVVDLGDGKGGKISLADATLAQVVLRRIHAEVTLTVDCDVTGYTFAGAELYNVPVGATYGWNYNTTTYPNNAVGTNFGYPSTGTTGLTPFSKNTSGTTATYKWFMGDNRRGEVTNLTAQTDRNSTKAPAYATFARVTLTSTSLAAQKIMYDIYLGSGAVTNFDVMRNHTYTVAASIKGTADFQEALIDTDARVSGVNMPIYLTDSRADSPFLILPKNLESTSAMQWGVKSNTNATDIFNGKSNTDILMGLSTTDYIAKLCRAQGAEWYLPAQAQLMLMWIYLPAVPDVVTPPANPDDDFDFWSSTSRDYHVAWKMDFWTGMIRGVDKTNGSFVRCVRDL